MTADFVLLNDQPVGESYNEDLLGSGDAARRIADLIITSRHRTPFTLGIDAGWGMGKSSLMIQVQEKLKSINHGVQTVWFNAWTSEGASALEGLIKSVLATLDENILRRALRKMTGRRQLLRMLWITLLIVASFFRLSRIVDELWDRFSVDARSRNEIRSEMIAIFAEWSANSKRSPNGRMLVVFIDDLDRCSAEVILAVCEAIKLYLDVPGIVFVIACDQNILAQAAKGVGPGSLAAAASVAYMEKIIQITYRKPSPDDDKINQLVSHYADLSGTTSLFTEAVKKVVIDRAERNPRRIKRLINSFILEYRLDPAWQKFGAETLMDIILLQHFYPDFYHDLGRPATRDIVHEFLTYNELRNSIQLGENLSDEGRKLFGSHRMRPPASDQDAPAALHRLEEEMPIEFPDMAKDAEFVSLVKSLSKLDDFDLLIDRLQSHPMATVTTRDLIEKVSTPPESELVTYDGLRVLWIDDNPDWIKDQIKALVERDASVATATDLQSARELLKLTTHPDVIISDISRDGDENAGLKDLEELRRNKVYDGPVIFYTSRITPSRQRVADSLGAVITSSREVLMEFLARIKKTRTATIAGDSNS